MVKLLKFLATLAAFSLFLAVVYAFFIGTFQGLIGIAVGTFLLLLTAFVTVILSIELRGNNRSRAESR